VGVDDPDAYHAPYRWTTLKIALACNVAQHVANIGEYYILREDNISNVVGLLNEEKEFARMPVTDHDVRSFFDEERRKYRWICKISEVSYVYGFSKRLHTLLMRLDCV
jgi:hypothetical protein